MGLLAFFLSLVFVRKHTISGVGLSDTKPLATLTHTLRVATSTSELTTSKGSDD